MDDAHRALLYAQLRAHALGLVDVGHIVLHGDGLLGAGLGALHAANAARGAGGKASSGLGQDKLRMHLSVSDI